MALYIVSNALVCTAGGPSGASVTHSAMGWTMLGSAYTGGIARTWWQMMGPSTFALGTKTDGQTLQLQLGSSKYYGSVIPFNQWFHWAITMINPSTYSRQWRLYLNGQLVVDTPDTSPWSTGGGLQLGASGPPINLMMSNYKHWANRVLSQADIQYEMRTKAPVRRAGLWCWLPLEQAIMVTGTIPMADKSGNNRPFASTAASVAVPGPILPYGEHKRNVIYAD